MCKNQSISQSSALNMPNTDHVPVSGHSHPLIGDLGGIDLLTQKIFSVLVSSKSSNICFATDF